jgi:hypothetical protein
MRCSSAKAGRTRPFSTSNIRREFVARMAVEAPSIVAREAGASPTCPRPAPPRGCDYVRVMRAREARRGGERGCAGPRGPQVPPAPSLAAHSEALAPGAGPPLWTPWTSRSARTAWTVNYAARGVNSSCRQGVNSGCRLTGGCCIAQHRHTGRLACTRGRPGIVSVRVHRAARGRAGDTRTQVRARGATPGA